MKQNLDRFKIAIFDKSFNVIIKKDISSEKLKELEDRAYKENPKIYRDLYDSDEDYSPPILWSIPYFDLIEKYQDNFIILQSTGLKDNKGNLIYEGDVVYIAGTGNYVVSPMEIYSIYAYSYSDDNMVKSVLMDALAEGDIGEVIGNIHTHPELLNI
jgi:hypothetical protein